MALLHDAVSAQLMQAGTPELLAESLSSWLKWRTPGYTLLPAVGFAHMISIPLLVVAIIAPIVLVVVNLIILAKYVDPEHAGGHYTAKFFVVSPAIRLANLCDSCVCVDSSGLRLLAPRW